MGAREGVVYMVGGMNEGEVRIGMHWKDGLLKFWETEEREGKKERGRGGRM